MNRKGKLKLLSLTLKAFYGLWVMSYFGDCSVIGQPLTVNSQPSTVTRHRLLRPQAFHRIGNGCPYRLITDGEQGDQEGKATREHKDPPLDGYTVRIVF